MNPPVDSSVKRVLDALDKEANNKHAQTNPALLASLRRYVTTGDEAVLAALAKPAVEEHSYFWFQLFKALPAPAALGVGDRRLLAFAGAAGIVRRVSTWFSAYAQEVQSPDVFQEAVSVLVELGWTLPQLVAMTAELSNHLLRENAPTAIGRWVLVQDESTRQALLQTSDQYGHYVCSRFLLFCARCAPETLRRFLDEAPAAAAKIKAGEWAEIVGASGAFFEGDALRVIEQSAHDPSGCFEIASALARALPGRHQPLALDTARRTLRDRLTREATPAAQWLAAALGVVAVPELAAALRQAPVGDYRQRLYREGLLNAAGTLGYPACAPVCDAFLETAPAEEMASLVRLYVTWDQPEIPALANAALVKALGEPRNTDRVGFIALVDAGRFPALEPHLWTLLEDKSKPARETAARKLAELGSAAAIIPRAGALLTARKAATRASAALLLGLLRGEGADAARAALQARLDAETDEGVREAIIAALPAGAAASGPATGAPATATATAPALAAAAPADIDALVARTAGKLTGPPVSWLDENALPPLYPRGDNAPGLSTDAVRFLLHRQSRCKEIAADAQAKPLLDLLDRARSGDFALAVVSGFLNSPQDAKDRWALAVGGLLGDGRTLRLLTRQIPEWVDHQRGKLAEYGAEAMALLGTDEALLALDALAIRYRSKYKNIGAAASKAFARAAEARGLTTDELGDRVVPWLGFPADGGPRVVPVGGERHIEVRVGLDFKGELIDAATRKKVTSWPASTPPEIKREIKEFTAALRDAAKAQTLRMENQFGRQRRWPVARWRELFLHHPLLRPFAVGLVWGEYAAEGDPRPGQTFRALPDGALTDAGDDIPRLGDNTFVGAVHPLELDADALSAWTAHLDDYKVRPPFAQLDRPIVRVTAEQGTAKWLTDTVGAELNALTFRSRAEKRGWTRGSVVDGGGICYYLKRFPGVDAFLWLDGMYIGAGMEDTVTLGKVFFVLGSSVKISGYTYDEPSDEKDPRLIALGEVPPVVFSEAAGDVRVIAGRVGSDDAP